MKYLVLFLLNCSLAFGQSNSSEVSAQEADRALSGLGSSNWGEAFQGAATNTESNRSTSDVVIDSSETVQVSCTRNEQTSLPYKFFLNLLANKSVSLTSNSSAGTLKLDTGKMIGNCNSMLKINFSQPQDGRPYLVQVGIRKPADCRDNVCSYDIQVAEGGVATGESKTVSVAPTYYGFIQCLKESGALNDDMSVNTSAVAPVELSKNFTGLTDTEPVWFYSHGPEAAKQGGVFSGNKKNENSCRYYEDISEGGFTYFSRADVRKNRKQALFDEICQSGDYREIQKRLPEFAEFAEMKSVLEGIRDVYLLKEVEKLHKELKRDDYSNLNADKYQRVIGDFYSKIIVPKRKMIERLIRDIESGNNGTEDTEELRAELKELTKELVKYTQAPYLTPKDYKNMKDFIKKSPLHLEAWREAALSLFSASSTSYNYSRYNEDYRRERELDIISTSAANDIIAADLANQREVVGRLGVLAEDTDASIARGYREQAENLGRSRELYAESAAAFYNEEREYLYNHCYNPSKYWVNSQRCAQDVMENVRMGQEEDTLVYDAMRQEYTGYLKEADAWSRIEAQRDQAYGVNRNGNSGRRAIRPEGNSQSYDPRAARIPQYAQNYEDFYNRMMGQNQPGPQGQQARLGIPQRGYNPMGFQQQFGQQQFRPQGGFQFTPALGRGPAQSPMYMGPQGFHGNSATRFGGFQFGTQSRFYR